MSSGQFVDSKYLMNDGSIAPIRIQPETLALNIAGTANAEPAGAIDFPITAKTGKTIREYGLGPRTVTIRFPVGSVPAGYKADSPIRLPLLTEGIYDAAIKGAAVTYLGETAEIVGRSPERVK